MAGDGLLIGEVAAKSGLTRKALRLYERAGILPPTRRTAAGYRVYGQDTLALLAFVTQARRLGFRLGVCPGNGFDGSATTRNAVAHLAQDRRSRPTQCVPIPRKLAVHHYSDRLLDEIKRITALKRSGRTPCTHVIDLVHLKLENTERALADLAEVRGQMQGLLRSWRSRRDRPAAVCPCIEHLKVVKGGR